MKRTLVYDLADGKQVRITDKAATFVYPDTDDGTPRKVRVELSLATLDALRVNRHMAALLAELFCSIGVEAGIAGVSPVIASAILSLMVNRVSEALSDAMTAFVAADLLEEMLV